MIPVDFPEANFTYTRPLDMTDEECNSLRVFKGITLDGFPCVISKWQPSHEDIKAILSGAAVYLNVTGQGMPPVALFTECPFEDATN